MTAEHKPHSEPTLEQLLAEGKVAGALILKGDFTDEERRLARGAYDAGFQHGRASLEEQLQTAEQQRNLLQREADMYKADRDEYDAMLGRKMAERDAALDREAGTSDALDDMRRERDGLLEQLEATKREIEVLRQTCAISFSSKDVGIATLICRAEAAERRVRELEASSPASEPKRLAGWSPEVHEMELNDKQGGSA